MAEVAMKAGGWVATSLAYWVVVFFLASAAGAGQISVKELGAKGNGIADDTAAIQATLMRGGDVYLPSGVYRITPRDSARNYTFLHLSGNTRMHGAGVGVTVLKVADKVGPYDQILLATGDASNLTIDDLTIDGSIAGNPIASTVEIYAHPREAMHIATKAHGILIERVEFRNMGSLNTIVTGSPAEEIVIRNCAFRNIGKDPNNIPHDHSTIYAHSNRVQILNNTFVSSGPNDPGTNTAIETHSAHSVASGNLIANFVNGMNITGVHYEDSQDNLVTSNVIRGGTNGIFLWSAALAPHNTGFGLNGLIVSNNVIELTQTKYGSIETHGIGLEANANLPVKNVAIMNNVIRFELEESPRKVSSPGSNNGISLWTVSPTLPLEDITIVGNIIENSPAAAIRLTANLKNTVISGNLIRNPASTKDSPPSGYLSGIASIVHAADTLIIRDNVIVDDLPTTRMKYGIFGLSDGPSTNVQWINNVIRVTGSARAAFVSDYGNSGNNIKPLILGVSDSFNPPIYMVQGGSRVNESATGKEWILPQDGGSDRWIARVWGSGPPASGVWRRGDVVRNMSPSAGGPSGWVCVVAGTPGTWKAMPNVAP
jgi:hypothetical protein